MQVSQAELFNQALDARLRGLHVATPARVERVDRDVQTVDVTPVFATVIPRGEDEDPLVENLPIIQAVPLVFARGGGSFITLPVRKGDFVLLVFSERALGAWRANGGTGVNPGDQRLHPLDGAMAIPGIFPRARALPETDQDAIALGHEVGLVVRILPDRVEVGGDGDAAALASRVDALEAAVTGHTHESAAPGSPTSTTIYGAALPPASGYASNVLRVGS